MIDAATALYGALPPPAPGPALMATEQPAAAPAPAPVAKPAVQPTSPERAAQMLYADAPTFEVKVPEEIAALRAESAGAEAALYPDLVEPAIQTHLSPLIEAGVPPEARQAIGAELTAISRDLGLDADGIRTIMSRGALPEVRNMTAEQIAANKVEAERLLAEEFGERAEQALADAKRLVARDPRVKALLNQSGLGDDPQTILQFARLAVRQRGAGRLK